MCDGCRGTEPSTVVAAVARVRERTQPRPAAKAGTVGAPIPWYGSLEHLATVDPALASIYGWKGHEYYLKDKGARVVKFVPNPAQDHLYRCIYEDRLAGRVVAQIHLKARQLGITTAIAVYFFASMRVIPGLAGTVVAHSLPDAEEIFRQKYGELAVQEHEHNPGRESKNAKTRVDRRQFKRLAFTRKDNGSQIRVVSSTARSGLGSCGQMIHLSEYPNFADPAGTYAALEPSLPNIAQPGVALFIESTGVLPEDDFARKYYDAVEAVDAGESSFLRPFFWNWLWDPSYQVDCDEQKVLESLDELEGEMVDAGATARQIAWWRLRVKTLGYDKALQQYPFKPEHAFGGKDQSAFDSGSIHFYETHSVREPLFKAEVTLHNRQNCVLDQCANGRLHVFQCPGKGRKYAIAADSQIFEKDKTVNGAKRNSDSGFVVVDVESGEIVATWLGDIGAWEFTDHLAAAGYYYNTAMLAPEVNQSGVTMVGRLTRELNYPNLYKRRSAIEARYDKVTELIGWQTTTRTRDQMLDLLVHLVAQRTIGIPCARLLNQMKSFVRTASGKRKPKSVLLRDELVICAAIASAVVPNVGWEPRTAENAIREVAPRQVHQMRDVSTLGPPGGRHHNKGYGRSPLLRLLTGELSA